MKSASTVKSQMKCGEVKPSYLPHKKIVMKYCFSNGKQKLVHAGAPGYGHNYSESARTSFHRRHKCASAKFATPNHLACTKLWGKNSGWKQQPPK